MTTSRPTNLEIIARAVIIHKGKILLCHSKGAKHFFLPGGHVEFGEKVADTLRREIKEELGASIHGIIFLDAIENVFTHQDVAHHEVNLVFRATINKTTVVSLEDHIEFYWQDIRGLSRCNILPKALKKKLLSWVKEKK